MSAHETIGKAIRQLIDDCEEFLVLEADAGRNYYIQFAGGEPPGADELALWVEAVSDNYLAPQDQLTTGASEQLLAWGWDPPTKSGDNWHRIAPAQTPEQIESLIALVIDTFRAAYGITDLAAIRVVHGPSHAGDA